MKIINIIEDKKYPEFYKIELTNITISLLNSFKQVMTSYINTFSFGNIDFKKNTTTIKNEQFAQMIKSVNLIQRNIKDKNIKLNFNSKDLVIKGTRILYMDNFYQGNEKIFIPKIYFITIREDETLQFTASLTESYASIDNAYTSVSKVGYELGDKYFLNIKLLETFNIKELINETIKKYLIFLDLFKKELTNTKYKNEKYIFKNETFYSILLPPIVTELISLDEKKEYFISYDHPHPQIKEYILYYNGDKTNIFKVIENIKKEIEDMEI